MPKGTVHNNDDEGSPINTNIGCLAEAKNPFTTKSQYGAGPGRNMNIVSYKPFLQKGKGKGNTRGFPNGKRNGADIKYTLVPYYLKRASAAHIKDPDSIPDSTMWIYIAEK